MSDMSDRLHHCVKVTEHIMEIVSLFGRLCTSLVFSELSHVPKFHLMHTLNAGEI